MTKNKRILLILLVTLTTRLYHINFPIAGWHSWRQADTAAIARNFATENMNIAYPAIDWRGATPGYVESEFQLYTFTIALLYKIFGIHEIFGRALSVICSVLTVLGLYLLVKKMIDEKTALWAALFYSILPLSIYYGRTFMPEQMMLMFSAFGIYFYSQWLDDNRWEHFLASVACISLAVLLKLPTLYLGLPLLFLSWTKFKFALFRQPKIWLFAVIVFIATFAWYYHSHSLKSLTGLTFGIWEASTDKWGNLDLLVTFKFYNDVLFKSLAERHFTYPAFVLFFLGLFLKRKSEDERMFDFWLIAVVVYFLIVAKGNQVHEYYQLPFMLPGVVFLAKPFSRLSDVAATIHLSEKTSRVVLASFFVVTIVLSVLRLVHIFNSERYDAPLFALSKSVQQIIPENDLVITLANGNPVVLYNAGRKGWNCSVADINNVYLEKKKKEGAQYFIGEKNNFPENGSELNFLRDNYKIIAESEEFVIVRL
ncbi:MAG: glycosyltransferase family 39 protein [Bacteroidota bacterium]